MELKREKKVGPHLAEGWLWREELQVCRAVRMIKPVQWSQCFFPPWSHALGCPWPALSLPWTWPGDLPCPPLSSPWPPDHGLGKCWAGLLQRGSWGRAGSLVGPSWRHYHSHQLAARLASQSSPVDSPLSNLRQMHQSPGESSAQPTDSRTGSVFPVEFSLTLCGCLQKD